MNLQLLYIGSDYNWLFILALFSLLQWAVTIPLVYKNKSTKLYILEEIEHSHTGYKRYISFLSDNFYWFWNIFPIIFFAYFFYIEVSWSAWMQDIFMLDTGNQIKKLYNTFFYSQAASYIDIAVLVLLGLPSLIFGYFAQDKKHEKMQEEESSLYWWSSQFNSTIYLLRKLFLVNNLILVGFLTYLITKISLFITLILYMDKLNIFPFHVDGYGGLHAIMEIIAILLAMYLLRASMGLIGLDDHRGQGVSHLLGDLLNIIYLPLAVGLSVIIFHQVKLQLNLANEKFHINEYLSSDIYQNFIQQFTTAKEKSEVLGNFFDYYAILSYSSFPVDISLFYNTAFTAVVPISLWFLVNHYQNKLKT